MIIIYKLIWDDFNLNHIKKHEVTPEEIEQVCQGKPLFLETYQQRLLAIGQTPAARVLTIILARVEEGTYYPITARPASRREREHYQVAQEEAS